MKAYLITTGVVFGLLTLAHVWRMFSETGFHGDRDPWFILITLISAAFSFWAFQLLRKTSRST
ncbi:MAG TPA: hypothetical protein VJ840_15715 [Gemmatimonadaceae bacterium]|nr:hypothetical protein [Gemmatimonadaceae bacterium]